MLGVLRARGRDKASRSTSISTGAREAIKKFIELEQAHKYQRMNDARVHLLTQARIAKAMKMLRSAPRERESVLQNGVSP